MPTGLEAVIVDEDVDISVVVGRSRHGLCTDGDLHLVARYLDGEELAVAALRPRSRVFRCGIVHQHAAQNVHKVGIAVPRVASDGRTPASTCRTLQRE